MKPNYFTVSLFILACTAFMSANTIEDNYQCPENKMQKDVENITIETKEKINKKTRYQYLVF